MKHYYAHVQFEAITVEVSAKNAREARKKVLAKVAKRKPTRLIDKNNFYIEAY